MQATVRQTVLVVDDDLLVRLDLSQAIELMGRDVVHVSSADAALDVLQEDDSIALVFTDIRMPGKLDGVELAEQIKIRWPSIRVVISSAHIATDTRCRTLGAPLLPKPYKLPDLREVLRTASLTSKRHDTGYTRVLALNPL